MDKKLSVVFVVIFLNFWIWKILKSDFVIGIFLILLSFALFFSFQLKKNYKLQILGVIFFAIISLLVLSSGFDERLKMADSDDIQKIRHSYLAYNLGPLYQNKYIPNYYAHVYPKLSYWQQNLAYSLDLNSYFFASHPREKAGFPEFEKYPFILSPFFVIGIIWMIIKTNKQIIIYLIFSVIINSLLTPQFPLGPVLFFPLINLLVTVGIFQFIQIVKMRKINIYEI